MDDKDEEIRQTVGEIPRLFQELEFDATAHDAIWEIFQKFELTETSIPAKYKHLIAFAAASAIHCSYSISFQTEAAKINGATDEELNEASLMALLVAGFSAYLHGRQIDIAEFKEELNRISNYLQTVKV